MSCHARGTGLQGGRLFVTPCSVTATRTLAGLSAVMVLFSGKYGALQWKNAPPCSVFVARFFQVEPGPSRFPAEGIVRPNGFAAASARMTHQAHRAVRNPARTTPTRKVLQNTPFRAPLQPILGLLDEFNRKVRSSGRHGAPLWMCMVLPSGQDGAL